MIVRVLRCFLCRFGSTFLGLPERQGQGLLLKCRVKRKFEAEAAGLRSSEN